MSAQPLAPPPFQIGEEVFVVNASPHATKEIVCPICCGKRFLTLILGDDSRQELVCDNCDRHDGRAGYVNTWAPHSSITPTASGLSIEESAWKIRVGNWTVDPLNTFRTFEEAESRRIVLHAQAEIDAEIAFGRQFEHKKKNGGWTVGYHRNCIKDAERTIEWHKSRLMETKR